MTTGALTLTTYPFDTVRLSCHKCGRKGRYRRAGLIERFGPDAVMPEVLRVLADCPQWGNMSDPCQAIYTDLSEANAS